MSKPDDTKELRKKVPRITKQNIKDIPLPALIRALNEELINFPSEEEKFISWRESDDDNDDGSGGHLVRLDKELHMARLILLEKTKGTDDVQIDSKFLIALVKLLSKSEKAVGWYGTKLKVWRRFLTLTIAKMNQEPIIIYDKKTQKNTKQVNTTLSRLKDMGFE
ncbi:MAG: hypothetical protein ABIG39_07955 [Candidatus Micrarchaeota archaeon]